MPLHQGFWTKQWFSFLKNRLDSCISNYDWLCHCNSSPSVHQVTINTFKHEPDFSLWQTSFSTNQLRLSRRQFLFFIFLISQHQNLKVIVDLPLNLKCCIHYSPTHPNIACLLRGGGFHTHCFLISVCVLIILIERSTLLDARLLQQFPRYLSLCTTILNLLLLHTVKSSWPD